MLGGLFLFRKKDNSQRLLSMHWVHDEVVHKRMRIDFKVCSPTAGNSLVWLEPNNDRLVSN